MVKTKTSRKPRSSLLSTKKRLKTKRKPSAHLHNPDEVLLDEDLTALAVWECLKDNDPEGVMEIIEGHLFALNKNEFAENHNIPKSTLFHSLRSKNPTLKTVAKIVHASYEETSR